MDQPDPMAKRRRHSAGHYDAVDAAIAAQPPQPSHITRTRAIDHGLEVLVDDGKGTAIRVTVPSLGRLEVEVELADVAMSVEVPLSTAHVLVEVIRAVAGMTPDKAAPITGSR